MAGDDDDASSAASTVGAGNVTEADHGQAGRTSDIEAHSGGTLGLMSWLRRLRSGRESQQRRSSMPLPPADAPLMTMLPLPKLNSDLKNTNEFVVTPSLVGQGGLLLPQLMNSLKEEQRVPGEAPVDDTHDECKCNPFNRPRPFLFALTCVYVFAYAGAFFGYGPMQLMLERNGAFSYLCDDDYADEAGADPTTSPTTCPEQNAMLLNVQLVAQLTMIASPFLGAWCDRNGPAEVAGGLLASGSLGILLLAVATSNISGIDWLLFPSFLCSGLMSQIAGLLTVQTGMIFADQRTRNRAISALNALYDAGAITYLILWYIDTHTRLTLPGIAGLYLVFFILVVSSAVHCWFKVQPPRWSYSQSNLLDEGGRGTGGEGQGREENIGEEVQGHEEEKEEVRDQSEDAIDSEIDDSILFSENASSGEPERASPDDGHGNIDEEHGANHNDDDNSNICASQKGDTCSMQGDERRPLSARDIAAAASSAKPDRCTPRNNPSKIRRSSARFSFGRRSSTSKNEGRQDKKTSMTFGGSVCDTFQDTPTGQPNPYILISKRPGLDQLRSGQFLTLAAFFAFHHSRNTWTLTTTRDFLAYLGDDETGNKYLAIFTLLTPASVLGLPFVDKIVHKGGYAAGLHVVNILAIGQGIIQVSSSNLNVQILGFVFYSFYRCFLFAVCFSCLPAFLGLIVLGKGYGLLIFSGGVCSLMNIPLANVAVKQLDGNFFVPNLIYTVLCAPCILLVWLIGRGFKREQEEKHRLAQADGSDKSDSKD